MKAGMKPPVKNVQRKQSAASAMFHEVSDRTRSSTGHSTLPAHMSESQDDEEAARRSSIAVLRLDKNHAYGHGYGEELTTATMPTSERPSWWGRPAGEDGAAARAISCGQRIRIVFDTLMLIAVGVGLFLAAHFTQNRAFPFILVVVAALATYESTWLAYRLRLRLFLPFQLHQKQTCRDIYSQIMNYSVDLQTCAITPIAERIFKGRKLLAAALTAFLCGGAAWLVAWFTMAQPSHSLVAYIALTTYLCVWCAALSPNLRDASVLIVRYVYFVLSTASLLMLSPPTASRTTPHAVLEPFHLFILSACLVLVARALTSKDPMETVVMALLDISSLIYLACLSNVVNYLVAFTSANLQDNESKAVAAARHSIVFGVFLVIWSAEVGSFLTEKLLREAQFPWTHPLSSRLSSRQNLEKLTGALLFGVAASFLMTDWILVRKDVLPINNLVMMATSIVAIVASHICKLWLISLKKVAKVSATGRYLRIGDGVIDRIDSLLVASVVFTVVLRRVLV